MVENKLLVDNKVVMIYVEMPTSPEYVTCGEIANA